VAASSGGGGGSAIASSSGGADPAAAAGIVRVNRDSSSSGGLLLELQGLCISTPDGATQLTQGLNLKVMHIVGARCFVDLCASHASPCCMQLILKLDRLQSSENT